MVFLFFSIKVQRLTRIIEINEADLVPGECEKVFFSKVFDAFQIQTKHELCLKLLSQGGAPIPDGKLLQIMLQYKNCCHFSIQVLFPDGFATTFMKLMLNEYLKEKKCDDLFIEEKNTQCLSVSSSKHLAQIITSFIEETFTLKASKDDISDVCKGAIALFPWLETKPSNIDGIDILYNDDKRSGFIYECIKYRTQKQAKKNKRLPRIAPESAENDFDMDELVVFFESCVLPRDNKKLKDKLAATADSRRNLLAQNQVGVSKMLNLYRVDPALISYDFKVLFPEIDENALLNAWETIKKKPHELFQVKLDEKEGIFHTDVDVHNFFGFMKLFQPHKIKLITAIKSFLVYSEDANAEPMNLVDSKNHFAHVIFIKAGDETKFYINIFNRLLSVSKDFNFIQVVDLFIKLHKIFDAPFHNHLQQVMSGFTAFVYRFSNDESKLTAKSLLCKHVFNSI